MENEITVASFKEAAKGPDGPEKVAQLIVDLVSDRNHWKKGAQELALHQLTVERERDELQAHLNSASAYIEQDLKIQADALKRVNAEQLTRIEELNDQLDDAEKNYTQVTRGYQQQEVVLRNQNTLINRLRWERDQALAENAKLREAVVQAPMVPSHVCSRECAHD